MIRNFCIIAHIDHGKSTLADRLLEITHTVERREMKEQLLDQMDIERERGITIKLQPVTMTYHLENSHYTLNLIDTPGHVDFSYEVSRSLAAVEGAVLLVDATQGVQAQTLANLYLALDQNLTIIPCLNKIDLPGARVYEAADEVIGLIGCERDDILAVSAKTGEGIDDLIRAIIRRIPAPQLESEAPSRALIFDSLYDDYRGVVAYVRMFGGAIKRDASIRFMATKTEGKALDIGIFKPKLTAQNSLSAGAIGYIVTGLKSVNECRVGDTIVGAHDESSSPLPGYKQLSPMVYAGIFCKIGDEFRSLREAIEKLKLNDASLIYEPEHSPALGFGFRCGFLGLLHLEIVQERLKREYGLEIIITVPSVEYRVKLRNGNSMTIRSPLELCDESSLLFIEEPVVTLNVITPETTIGPIMNLVAEKQGTYITTEFLSQAAPAQRRRVIMRFELPLSAILVDFYDRIKSISAGYASMNYKFLGYRQADIVRLDVSVADNLVEELSSLVYRNQAYHHGRRITESLKKTIERQQFEIRIQASVGSKVIASERIAPYRKDVTAKLYGGDVTRKQKLLEKQKRGKKRMKQSGHVDIPPEAYLTVLRRS